MTFTSINDLYFFVGGLFALNIISGFILSSKLFLLPIILSILGDASKDYEQGNDVFASFRKMELRIYLQMFVIIFAFVPAIPLHVDRFEVYQKQCDTAKNAVVDQGFFSEDELAENLRVIVSGREMKMPLALAMAIGFGTGFSLQAVSELPCALNVQVASKALLDTRIEDKSLQIETKEFVRQCYQPALSRAVKERDQNIPWIEDPRTNSRPWPGHNALMNDAYYGNTVEGFYSQVLLEGWQGARNNQNVSKWVMSEREGDCGGACLHEIGGFPSCREWWQGIGAGFDDISVSSSDISLRKRLWESLPDEEKEQIWPLLDIFSESKSDTLYQDRILEKAYFNSVSLSRIKNAEVKDYALEWDPSSGSWFTRLLGTIGNYVTAIPDFATSSMVQLAAPIIKGALIGVLIVVWPFVCVVSTFNFKIVFTYAMLIMSVLFWPFFWELTILMQESYFESVAERTGIPLIDLLAQPNTILLSQKITDALFVAFPVIVTSLLSFAGMTAGNAMNAGKLGTGAGSAGAVGSKVGGKLASKGAGKLGS